ncbi:hypothetical protein OOJ91_12180 [Micromonospora lupini]|uniref:hypothetical protein n=1 Tax=Micromonospora lupini TaxID=285679 RepID=UPI0022594172|nr:hypothetical protein [Micromonospora lupini]MCX5066636.1 hypothetical protein [Micromonospora lupini]
MTDTHHPDRQCISDIRCKGYDHVAKHPAWTDPGSPFCEACLAAARRDVRTLLYDWVDLAQMQAPSLSQAMNAQPGARRDPPMPLRGDPEALQQEIHHVLTTWETEVRAAAGLADLPPLSQHGAAVQRAVTILEPRVRLLSALPPTAVYPTGCEDPVTDLAGWEAVEHLQRLRARARSMLGWTFRSRWVPGDCWACDGRDADDKDGPLFRAEPRYEQDDCEVWCARCQQHRPADEYDEYVQTLRWPGTITATSPAEPAEQPGGPPATEPAAAPS